jgi:hypothetical protein
VVSSDSSFFDYRIKEAFLDVSTQVERAPITDARDGLFNRPGNRAFDGNRLLFQRRELAGVEYVWVPRSEVVREDEIVRSAVGEGVFTW